MQTEREWRRQVRDWLAVMTITGVSAALTVAAAVATAYPSQSLEALRVVAEDAIGHPGSVRALLLVFVSVVFCGGVAWYWARVLTRVRVPGLQGSPEEESVLRRRLTAHLPRVWGILPALGVAVGFARAAMSSPGTPKSARTVLWICCVLALLLAVLMYAGFILRRRFIEGRKKGSTGAATMPPRVARVRDLPRETLYSLAGTSALWLFGFVAVATTYGHGLWWLGPVGVLMVSIGTWIPALSALSYYGHLRKFPAITALATWIMLFSCFNLNDNHEIRHTIVEAPRALPPEFGAAFNQWLASRPDRDNYDSYPVFLIAAEGGGLRAAYFTSLVLSAIQDRCPAFAQHVFAISSVSGGSFGASIFAALAAHRAPKVAASPCVGPSSARGDFQTTADAILARDFLTPLFAAGMYTDVVQKLFPFPVGAFDRARALENGLEKAWKDVTNDDQFSKPFYSLWPSFAQGSAPALFLNTTRVETGDRMVISTLYPLDERFNRLISLADLDNRMDVRLSTAAALSARFPIVTPIGGIPVSDSVYRYADGGYFDNSGIATLSEMLAALHVGEGPADSAKSTLGSFKPIVIRIGFQVRPTAKREGKRRDASVQWRIGTTSQGFNEVLSPIRTLLNTRSAREVTSVRQLRSAIATFQDNRHDVELIEFQLLQEKVPLITGWLMSGTARKEMTRQMGPPLVCVKVIEIENECSFGSVVQELLATTGSPGGGK